MTNKLLGVKIKQLRKSKKMTQAALAGDIITRNMLSSIENGAANPSIKTLEYLAERLGVSVSYLLSDEEDLLPYEKKRAIDKIYRAYEAENYKACINIINSLSDTDNELNYMLTDAYLQLGKKSIENGALETAKKNLNQADFYSQKTKIPSQHLRAQIAMYLAVATNIQSPLLEFNSEEYVSAIAKSVDYEFFKYLTLDFSYPYICPSYRLHIEAKALIKDRKYNEAIKLLLRAVEETTNEGYDAFVIFGIYTDLEYCYKQMYNFEKAYLYSTKRLTLIEEFKT